MKKPNILFADFDGPLWSDRVIRYHPDNRRQDHQQLDDLKNVMITNGDTFAAVIVNYWKMDDVAVGMLNQLMDHTPFLTVVSSSWREICSKATIEYIFAINGLKLKLHDDWSTTVEAAPRVVGWSGRMDDRVLQVKAWLDEHEGEIENYAVLDDPGSGGGLASESHVEAVGLDPKNMIIVDYTIGMEQHHYGDLFRILCK